MKKQSIITQDLEFFFSEHKMGGKGPLSLALVLTRNARNMPVPFEPKNFLTPSGGQVKGMGGPAVRAILNEYGISRILSEEGGRTSRGSIQRMHAYLNLLNKFEVEGALDFDVIESWWIERVREYFRTEPLRVKLDASMSLRGIVRELIDAAFARQQECSGTMVAGAVMQHLVGAKLSIALPHEKIQHHGFSVADASGQRAGDFVVHDTAIHVTTAPTDSLIRKCAENLKKNLRPIIITTKEGVGGAEAHARNAEIINRLDVIDIEQFIAANVYEWSAFKHEARPTAITDLVQAYNNIVELCETDPSLKIALG